jgi:rare lipoprotein A (peptidoglycan hydrolase)
VKFPNRYTVPLAVALALALILPATSPAIPSAARVATSQAMLDRALQRDAAARTRLDDANAKVEAASARLDDLVAEQNRAQARLNSDVALTYRLGPDSFIALLTGSESFEVFAARWALLVRINQRRAQDLAALKEARQRTVVSARSLMELQTSASQAVREVDIALARARADLSSSKAAYAEYQRRIAARAAAEAAARRAAQRAAIAKAASRQRRAPAAPAAPVSTGAPAATGSDWRIGRASNYGPGSYGRRTANGTRIGPDSMIVAHKTLPFGTIVQFNYGGRSAIAVVADRGPYVPGREWDLGPGVAHVLGLNGVYMVRYRVVGR